MGPADNQPQRPTVKGLPELAVSSRNVEATTSLDVAAAGCEGPATTRAAVATGVDKCVVHEILHSQLMVQQQVAAVERSWLGLVSLNRLGVAVMDMLKPSCKLQVSFGSPSTTSLTRAAVLQAVCSPQKTFRPPRVQALHRQQVMSSHGTLLPAG